VTRVKRVLLVHRALKVQLDLKVLKETRVKRVPLVHKVLKVRRVKKV